MIVIFHMMHHAVSWGTTLCCATLHPPEIKSWRIIWCIVQREHIVENGCDLLRFKCFQTLQSTQFTHSKSFEHFIVHSTKIFCTFETGIQPWRKKKLSKMADFYLIPRGTTYVIICTFILDLQDTQALKIFSKMFYFQLQYCPSPHCLLPGGSTPPRPTQAPHQSRPRRRLGRRTSMPWTRSSTSSSTTTTRGSRRRRGTTCDARGAPSTVGDCTRCWNISLPATVDSSSPMWWEFFWQTTDCQQQQKR